MSVTRNALTDLSYENVKSVESNLKATVIERDRLATEKAELERVSVEKGEMFKRFISQVIRDKQIQADILETEKALRISESEQVRELEICLKTQQETIESLKADKKGLEEDLYGARALLNVSNSTIANLEFQLEQERIQNREVPEKLEDSDASINSWSSETEVHEETNKCHYTVRNPVVEHELRDEFVVSNIYTGDYGRVIGKGGRRVAELQERYDGVKVLVTKPRGPKGPVEVNLIGADPDSRRAVARSIIDDLPIEVDVDFRGARLNSAIKNKSYVYRVDVTENGDGSYCLFGRPDSCKQYYEYVCYELMCV